ncbi:MAG: prephenate dehydrogenase/arogenate dehydrogenase family protein [Myxococcota bacterium]
MKPLFERVALVGMGLLGGSLGLAARERGVAGRVVGASRSRESLDAALACGALDEAFRDPVCAARGADLVVLATPPFAMPGVVRRLAGALAQGAVVSDVGSVKAAVAEALPGLLPPGVRYLGAHPMAGSHRKGVAHARADLFEGATCVLTPTPELDRSVVERLTAFWERIGARVVERRPEEHDCEVAWVSHLPHALAFAFSRALDAAPARAGQLTGGGFRDFTRIARSDPELWAEILTANHKALAGPLREAAVQLEALSRSVEAGDVEAVARLVAEAHEILGRMDAERTGHPKQISAAPGGRERSR